MAASISRNSTWMPRFGHCSRPRPRKSGKKIKTICLDPGHGGKDPGNRLPGRQEKDYTLRLAFELRDQLKQAGFKVVFTRSSDQFIELSERPELARRAGADLFVSLHFNGTDGGRAEARGSEVYCLTPAGAASTNARGEGARTRRLSRQSCQWQKPAARV